MNALDELSHLNFHSLMRNFNSYAHFTEQETKVREIKSFF